MDLTSLAKVFIFLGVILLICGSTLYFLSKLGIGLGKLPGDILIQKENFTFYFPLATSIILSIILSVILGLILKK